MPRPGGEVNAGDLLNRFCQARSTKPQYAFAQVPGAGWRCVLTVDGAAFDAEATGANQKEAKQLAVYDFVSTLQASGLAGGMPMSKSQFKRGRCSGPDLNIVNISLPPAKRPQTGSASGALPPGRLDANSAAVSSNASSIDSQVSQISTHLRKAQPEAAMKVIEERLGGMKKCLTVRQLANILHGVSVRSEEEPTVELLVKLIRDDYVSFTEPSAAMYFCRFARWALKELLAEGQACMRQCQTVPASTLETNGICISSLTAHAIPEKVGVEMDLVTEGLLPRGHSFQKGDWVLATFPHEGCEVGEYGDPRDYGTFEAELVKFLFPPLAGISVKLVGTSPHVAQQLHGQTCRVDRSANRVTYLRQIEALRGLCDVPGPLVWLRALLLAGDEKDVKVSHGVEASLCSQTSVCHLPNNLPLWSYANESQKAALEIAMGRRLTLIQGPPGSGKTHTAVLLVKLWVAMGRGPVLVSTESNVAVDNLVSGCVRAGLDAVRVGRPEVTRPDLESHTLIEKARSTGSNSGEKNQWCGEKSILSRSQVICCTCSGCDQPVLEGMKFQSILIDEAAQATELAVLMPLLHLRPTGSAVLVGDHRQLPPTIISLDAQREGFAMSLFDRLATRGVEPLLLDVQYRMHPAIATFPSAQFYGGRLRSGVGGPQRRPIKGIMWPEPQVPVAFFPVLSEEASEGNSFTNIQEAKTVKAMLQAVLQEGDCPENGIGVITPYAAQARLIRKLLGLTRSGLSHKTGHMGIEVSSVDGFQGREKELIIFSAVRANPKGSVGFLADARRLNVSLTRARRGLVVCGEPSTLSHDRDGWLPWIRWAQEHGLVAGAPATSPEKAAVLRSLDEMEPGLLWEQPGQ